MTATLRSILVGIRAAEASGPDSMPRPGQPGLTACRALFSLLGLLRPVLAAPADTGLSPMQSSTTTYTSVRSSEAALWSFFNPGSDGGSVAPLRTGTKTRSSAIATLYTAQSLLRARRPAGPGI